MYRYILTYLPTSTTRSITGGEIIIIIIVVEEMSRWRSFTRVRGGGPRIISHPSCTCTVHCENEDKSSRGTGIERKQHEREKGQKNNKNQGLKYLKARIKNRAGNFLQVPTCVLCEFSPFRFLDVNFTLPVPCLISSLIFLQIQNIECSCLLHSK